MRQKIRKKWEDFRGISPTDWDYDLVEEEKHITIFREGEVLDAIGYTDADLLMATMHEFRDTYHVMVHDFPVFGAHSETRPFHFDLSKQRAEQVMDFYRMAKETFPGIAEANLGQRFWMRYRNWRDKEYKYEQVKERLGEENIR